MLKRRLPNSVRIVGYPEVSFFGEASHLVTGFWTNAALKLASKSGDKREFVKRMQKDRKLAPTPKEFATQFERAVEVQCAEKPRTVGFYKTKVKSPLADDSLSSARLDRIEEAAIDAYTQERIRAK